MLAFLLAGGATARMTAAVPHADLGIDDANIFLTFGRNVAAGHGFVYSPGGERVEGFTSLLWVLVAAASCAIAPRHPQRLLLGANVAFLAATAVLLLVFRREDPGPRRTRPLHPRVAHVRAAALLAWLFLAPAHVLWTTITLMDTGLWTFVVTAMTLAAVWRARASDPTPAGPVLGALLALAPLTRPESLLVGPLVLALGGVLILRRSSWATVRARLQIPAALLAGSIVVVTGFRLVYFGYPFPNTFYAKVSPSLAHNLLEGASYVAGFLGGTPAALLSAGAAVVVLATVGRRSLRGGGRAHDGLLGEDLAGVSFVALVVLFLPVLTGGDHFPGYRFCQPAWPLLALPPLGLAIECWSALRDARSARPWLRVSAAAFGVLFLAGLVSLGAASLSWRRPSPDPKALVNLDLEFAIAADGRAIGKALNTRFPGPAKPLVGATMVGGLAYGYEGPVFDMLGLTSVRMAHSPGLRLGVKDHAAFDETVFYEVAPELVEPTLRRAYRPGKPGTLDPWTNRVLGGLLESDRFRSSYSAVVLGAGGEDPRPDGPGFVQVWARRDLIDDWRRRGLSLDEVPLPRVRR